MALFYIATSLSRRDYHNRIRDVLTKNGHTITYDWTLNTKPIESIHELSDLAQKEAQGVSMAQIVVVLLPGGLGTHAELGIALGLQKKILLHSAEKETFTSWEGRCAFYQHPNVSRLACYIDDNFAFLKTFEGLFASKES